MKYRPEVDGLRTIAVLPVILFHAGVSVFSGGYVGVDVFFVISGYLITGILASELAEDRFSITRFYERRARRILPALFAVMLACLPFAWFWMLPSEMLNFSRSMIAVSAFASNVLFFMQAGYFAPNAEELPLLHTWSLAVEEQYYIIFPVLLWALWRLGRGIVWGVLAVIAVVSLALCQLLVTSQPDATFYLIHTRAWELLAGSLIALWQLRGGPRAQDRSETGAALGLAMILYGIFMFDEHTPFPSLWALLPVGGTALVLLFAAKDTLAARLLSLRVMVGIGLISYSAYLIHQPLLAFARIRSITEPDPMLLLAMAALTMPLAWFSWRFIERPFRQPGGVSRSAIFAGSAIGLTVFISLGALGHVTRGLPDRLPQEVVAMAGGADNQNPRKKKCFHFSRNLTTHPVPQCMSEGIGPVAVIGDSHADALAGQLHPALVEAGYGVYESTSRGCWPMTGFQRITDVKGKCDQYNRNLFDYIDQSEIDLLILTSRWTIPVVGTHFNNLEGGHEVDPRKEARDLIDRSGPFGANDDPERQERVLTLMKQNLEDLLERYQIILVYPIPEAGWHVPNYAARRLLHLQSPGDLDTSLARYKDRNAQVIDLFDGITHPNLYRIRPTDTLCNITGAGRCANTLNGQALYYDDDHLSQFGAALLSPAIVDLVSQISVDHRND